MNRCLHRVLLGCLTGLLPLAAQAAPDLRVGASFHAFDHLYGFVEQAKAAVACGVTVTSPFRPRGNPS
jgi:hypothetical protein